MNNIQIGSLLSSCSLTKRHFHGIYASDTLPNNPHTKPSSYICNLDPSTMSGSHWVCFYFPLKGLPEYFDSFGFPPTKNFENFLGYSYIYNPGFIQYPLSTVCGQYCIYYLWQRALNKSMYTILSEFDSENLLYNDMLVNNAIENHFSVDLDIFNVDFVSNQLCLSYKQLENNIYYD